MARNGKYSARDGDWNQPPYAFPYSCIMQRPDPAVGYYEAYKNIGRKYTILKRYDLAYDVIQAAINVGGKICIKKATYPIGATTLTLPLTDTFWLEIEAELGMILQSSATTVLDVTNAAWSIVAALKLKNLKIEHNCQNATDITLDLLYSHAILEDVWLVNYNATKQGTAVKIGPTGGAGKTVTSKDLTATGYGIGFDVSLDHFVGINLIANKMSDKAFSLHDCVALQLFNPQVYNPDAIEAGTVYPFYIDHLGWGCEILNPSLELGAPSIKIMVGKH